MYNNQIDPEILAIMGVPEAQSFEQTSAPNAVQESYQMNETPIKTMSLDSQGNMLRVGDKVTVGNDKATGRIVALGKYATVSLPGEGTMEFPCTVLTLVNATPVQESMPIQPPARYQLAQPIRESRPLSNRNDKFSSYTVESLQGAGIDFADNMETDDIMDAQARLTTLNNGVPFDMGVKQ